jgi:CO/xanthine dehydrogenase FAD-binding subunit
MDLIDVREVRSPRTRDELRFEEGARALGGGTWLYSEPQPDTTVLVDLMALGWTPIERTDAGLTVAATCTIAELAAQPHPLFAQCANALLASFKIWNVATVGGNVALSLPAGPMISLGAALDATVLLWTTSTERRVPVSEFVTGVGRNLLEPGEVIRAIEFPAETPAARHGFRRISLSPLGRTGTLVIGVVGAEAVFTVTGGTTRPHVLRFASLPTADALVEAIDGIDDWYDDAHGSPDWRRAMSLRLALELLEELS